MKWLFKLLRCDAYLLIRQNGKKVQFNWKANGVQLNHWFAYLIMDATEGTVVTPLELLLEIQRIIELKEKVKEMKEYMENEASIEAIRSQHPIN